MQTIATRQRPHQTPEAMTTEQIHLQLVDVVPLREQKGSYYPRIGTALARAGVTDAEALHFRTTDDTSGMLVGVASTTAVDGRSNPDARSLYSIGDTIEVAIPPRYLEDPLGIDTGELDPDHPPLLAVYAGDHVIAFEPAASREVAVDREIDT